MFTISWSTKMSKALIATSFALGTFTLNSQAALSNYSVNGQDFVYSSVSNVTWTRDANLLSTLISRSSDADGNGTLDVIDAIEAITPNSLHTFLSDGRTTWWGANAFVAYLNSISYGGSDNWRLPTVVSENFGFVTATNGTVSGDELSELYFDELGSKAANPANSSSPYGISDPNNHFKNLQSDYYWYGTEYADWYNDSWFFTTSFGTQYYGSKASLFYVWVINPGTITVVPEPNSLAMLLAGLGLLFSAMRHSRNIKNQLQFTMTPDLRL